MDVYSHVLPHMQHEAADRVLALLRGPEGAQGDGWRTIGTQGPMAGTGKPS